MNYLKIYNNLVSYRLQTPPNKNYEEHHIYPKSLFPELKNEKSNIVRLTYKEHYIAHHLLYRYYKFINDKNAMIKMGFAWFRMCKNYDGLHVSLLQYEKVKKINKLASSLRSKNLWSCETYKNKMMVHLLNVSDETKKKMSEKRKGRTPSKDKHWKLSDETKKKMSSNIWIHNNYIETRCSPEKIPKGFTKGRLKKNE